MAGAEMLIESRIGSKASQYLLVVPDQFDGKKVLDIVRSALEYLDQRGLFCGY